MTILRGNDISVTWTITDCATGLAENFSGAELAVYLLGGWIKKPVEHALEGNAIVFRVRSDELEAGKYSLEAVWTKDGEHRRAVEYHAFEITENPYAVTCNHGQEPANHLASIRVDSVQ